MKSIVTLLVAVSLIGCARARNDKSSGGGGAGSSLTIEENPGDARLQELHKRISAISESLTHVGYRDSNPHLARAFDNTASALQLIACDNPDGAFQQRIAIIKRSQAQLAGARSGSLEPTTDAAMRAVYGAVVQLNDRFFAGDKKLSDLVNQLGQRVRDLDNYRGALHDLSAAGALDVTTQALNRMGEILQQRQHGPATLQAPSSTLGVRG